MLLAISPLIISLIMAILMPQTQAKPRLQTTTKIWSILICTLEERKDSFNKLYNTLQAQIKENMLDNKIEVLSHSDNREMTVGCKRNLLLNQSKGEYTCYIDDDDDIHPNYIKMIYEKLQKKPDCVSLTGIVTVNGKNPKKFIHSLAYKTWFEKDGIYYRPPNHLNPIKRSIAIRFLFPEIRHGEDVAWCLAIVKSGLLQKQELINEPYYFYNYNTNTSACRPTKAKC